MRCEPPTELCHNCRLHKCLHHPKIWCAKQTLLPNKPSSSRLRPHLSLVVRIMAQSFPYTYISCPCSDESSQSLTSQRASRDLSQEGDLAAEEEEEKPFNPHHPRSNYSLFPPEYLFYCEECHDLKCPRCSTEEIVCWYCPSCLFETPSSMLRSEGNRSDLL